MIFWRHIDPDLALEAARVGDHWLSSGMGLGEGNYRLQTIKICQKDWASLVDVEILIRHSACSGRTYIWGSQNPNPAGLRGQDSEDGLKRRVNGTEEKTKPDATSHGSFQVSMHAV